MNETPPAGGDARVVVLGAGYAGLAVAHEVYRRSRGKIPTVLVDRHPVHVLRTELYEVGKLAGADGNVAPWTVPLGKVFERTSVTFRSGTVQHIDLPGRSVVLDTGRLAFGSLVIGLGSVPAYYGVPGASEFTHGVYRLTAASRLAATIRAVEEKSPTLAGERRPRFVVVGGGSTGTEVAAEIATTNWAQVVSGPARPPEVLLVTGALPFLQGLPPALIAHARKILVRAGVPIFPGYNATRVEPNRLYLEDGTVFAADIIVWCAGIEAPPLIRELPVVHGRGGRLKVRDTLELPDHPGVFGVGDVVEFQDPVTGMFVPQTAQAALAEARVAGQNVVATWTGATKVPFRYTERGVIVALGRGKGAGAIRHLTVWGRPAALVKRVVERGYSRAVASGKEPSLL